MVSCCNSVQEIEEDLDVAYQSYLQRQGVRAAAAREKRRRLGMDGEMGSDEEEARDGAEYEPGSDAEEAVEVSLDVLLLSTCQWWAVMLHVLTCTQMHSAMLGAIDCSGTSCPIV